MTSFASVPAETEALAAQVITAAIAVHRELGAGLLEAAYRRALAIELRAMCIPFESEKAVVARYRGIVVATHRLDLMVGEQLVVEAKAVSKLEPVHEAQLLCYLKLTGARLGLLLNFHTAVLRNGIRRMVL